MCQRPNVSGGWVPGLAGRLGSPEQKVVIEGRTKERSFLCRLCQGVHKYIVNMWALIGFPHYRVEESRISAKVLKSAAYFQFRPHPPVDLMVIGLIRRRRKIICFEDVEDVVCCNPAAAYSVTDTFTGKRIDKRRRITQQQIAVSGDLPFLRS